LPEGHDTFRYVGTYPNGKEIRLAGLDPDQGAICLAVLRRDGFVSLDAGEEEGSVTTRSFKPPGDGLYVNCDASGGWIAVQLLDDQEHILAASERLTGDHDRCEVKWLKGALGERQQQAVALRFTMRSASLYSFWFEGG
jgi:hypothetical protein